ncbi:MULTISPECIES: CaiB/BaiF CoA-transferase family protein [Variovorax]|uniref:Alpha-methylacyl-CoA racemase n=1 Tax=Variovorax paradoxus TaxID=34073 RepID=A0AAW8EQY3_VARPD|nr:CaiB/BaiF CoA-transferase family protein [Variovorax paradoxus]MDP9974845.1 alpha-methylacyl-CoA racemase [Variovorax paradoxus]
MTKPLKGVTVIEMAGLGPGPCAGTLLADAGASVIRVEGRRTPALSSPVEESKDPYSRGRRIVTLDLKQAQGVEAMLRLVERADALIEGYRPGVMERLGLGPDACLARRPSLVYGRVTGWGQSGPLAHSAGHDINYIAIAGALHAIGTAGSPVVPLNLVGDLGGGGAILAFAIASGLLQAARTGCGEVIDVAMTDCAAFLMAPFYARLAAGTWLDERSANIADGGAPHYSVYRCNDGRFIAMGPLEPKFWDAFVKRMGLESDCAITQRNDPATWPALRRRLQEIFVTRTRDEWVGHFDGVDACVSPVLCMQEALTHPHNVARGTFVDANEIRVPCAVPRFGASASSLPPAPVHSTGEVLSEFGFSRDEVAEMLRLGVAE